MANYQTISYVREAVQLIIDDLQNVPNDITINGLAYPVYRDQGGFYILANTKYGNTRVSENQWMVLLKAEVPGDDGTPQSYATGSISIAADGIGDGDIAFSYNGTNYKVKCAVGQAPETTSLLLRDEVNKGKDLTAISVGDAITLQAVVPGPSANLPLEDTSTETEQVITLVGMEGGTNYTPGIPAQPAVFEVLNDSDFLEKYEPEVV